MLPQVCMPIKRRGLLAGLAVIVGGLTQTRATAMPPVSTPPAPILLLEGPVAGTAYYDANRLLVTLAPDRP